MDIMIALETLYGENRRGGIAEHLSKSMAWHIGQNFKDRKEVYDTVREGYRKRSKIVHGASIDIGDLENRKLLNYARMGISKIIEEGKLPDIHDLMLGKSFD